MKYLILGCSGVVGKYLVKELLKDKTSHIVGITRKARYLYEDYPDKDLQYIECYAELTYPQTRLINMFQPDIIYHCAGNGTQNANPKDLWKSNVDTTFNLLEACSLLKKPVKFIYCSSSVVVNGKRNIYRASKETGEILINTYSSDKLSTICVRFPAVVGAGNNHGVLKDIVKKLIKSNDFPFMPTITLLNNSRRPFVYAEQLAEKIVDKVNKPYCSNFQLCSPDTYTVENIARKTMSMLNIEKKIIWDESYKDFVAPIKSNSRMHNCQTAIELAVRDILKEDYGYEQS